MKNIIIHADDFGRSQNISKSIYECIKKNIVNSVSIIVSEKIHGQNFLIKSNVKKRLHINLTDFSKKKSNENNIYNYSFLTLLFMPFFPNFNERKKNIENEIIRQIKIYKKTFKIQNIFIDGHQHVHMIPWIFNIIYKLRKKEKIINIRIPNEKFIINIEDCFRVAILKNILKLLLIKFLIFLSSKKIRNIKYEYNFFGIIYSGHQNLKYISKIVKKSRNKNLKRSLEILIHPGYAKSNEKSLFKKDFFEYYSSKYRKLEFNLVKNLKLDKII